MVAPAAAKRCRRAGRGDCAIGRCRDSCRQARSAHHLTCCEYILGPQPSRQACVRKDRPRSRARRHPTASQRQRCFPDARPHAEASTHLHQYTKRRIPAYLSVDVLSSEVCSRIDKQTSDLHVLILHRGTVKPVRAAALQLLVHSEVQGSDARVVGSRHVNARRNQRLDRVLSKSM